MGKFDYAQVSFILFLLHLHLTQVQDRRVRRRYQINQYQVTQLSCSVETTLVSYEHLNEQDVLWIPIGVAVQEGNFFGVASVLDNTKPAE